ncbi:hypothetical protein S83_068345, partial [Arachis hypogaea]
ADRRPVQPQAARHSPLQPHGHTSAPLTTAKKHVHGPSKIQVAASSPTASCSSVVSRHLRPPSSLLECSSLHPSRVQL